MKFNKVFFIFCLTLVIILGFWLTGFLGFWFNGMSYIVNNTEDFTDINGHIIEEEYTISIDLSDLESNIGIELYNDGTHRIYVSWVENTGDKNSGGYIIGFRSSGDYSLSGASLVSGIHHETVEGRGFAMSMSANMNAEYKGKFYNSQVSGRSGINYKDGDFFSFYIFPSEAYENEEVSLNETGVVHLTVTDLYNNVWSKK